MKVKTRPYSVPSYRQYLRYAAGLFLVWIALSPLAGLQTRAEKGDIKLLIPSFLGNEHRSFYGYGPVPDNPRVLWKVKMGGGLTRVWKKTAKWHGTGWHGQAILVEENGKKYVLVGAFDYCLWKMDASSGQVIWKHKFENVIKSVPTIIRNDSSPNEDDRYVVLCGSRKDYLKNGKLTNYRAISYRTGKGLWSLSFPATESNSRDMDASGLYSNGVLYVGSENGCFYCIDPLYIDRKTNALSPKILKRLVPYSEKDVQNHANNIAIESYPAILKNTVFETSSSGHVFGVDRDSETIVWDFPVGSDIDGSPVVTGDNKLLVSIEKQYIEGKGGVFMFDPARSGPDSVDWYFPVEDRKFASWEGGIIGSVAINDEYNQGFKKPALAAFNALDGNVYLVARDELSHDPVKGPHNIETYRAPVLVWKAKIGPSISTPLLLGDYLITCGYDGKVRIFKLSYSSFTYADGRISGLVKKFVFDRIRHFRSRDGKYWKISIRQVSEIQLCGPIESTPIVWDGKIYIGTRGGYFYCIGS